MEIVVLTCSCSLQRQPDDRQAAAGCIAGGETGEDRGRAEAGLREIEQAPSWLVGS